MSLYAKLLGHPLVYDYIRPLAVGGIDLRASYANLDAGTDDVIVDVGCGTGNALSYLGPFREYHGFDEDPVAIRAARTRPVARRGEIHFYDRPLGVPDLERLQPTRVMMSGLLHHLSDDHALDLLRACAGQRSIRRIATNDTVFVPGHPISNLLARMDRGRHVREIQGYRRLAEQAGLTIVKAGLVRSHRVTGLAIYFLMALERAD